MTDDPVAMAIHDFCLEVAPQEGYVQGSTNFSLKLAEHLRERRVVLPRNVITLPKTPSSEPPVPQESKVGEVVSLQSQQDPRSVLPALEQEIQKGKNTFLVISCSERDGPFFWDVYGFGMRANALYFFLDVALRRWIIKLVDEAKT